MVYIWCFPVNLALCWPTRYIQHARKEICSQVGTE